MNECFLIIFYPSAFITIQLIKKINIYIGKKNFGIQ